MLCRFVGLLSLAMLGAAALPGGMADEPNPLRLAGPEINLGRLAQATNAAPGGKPAAPAEAASKQPEHQVEEVIERYPNGMVKIQRHVVLDAQRNYVNHGLWTLHDTQGTPIAKGSYYQGKRQGTWSRLQPKSSKNFSGPEFRGFAQPFVWEAQFADDQLHGTWTMLDAEGRQVRTWEFEQGQLHGRATDWRPDGSKRRESQYLLGVPCGETHEWNDAGKLVVHVPYRDGQPLRNFVDNYPTGKKRLEGWYLGTQEKVRVTFNWWEGRMLIETSRAEGKDVRQGKWNSWHPEGSKQYEGEYLNDLPTGMHTWWHVHGQKHICGHFVQGRETGRWTWWHDNGHRALEGEFVDGKREGGWTAWHANGHKQQSGTYIADQKQGAWITWDAAGKVIESRDHTASANLNTVIPGASQDLVSEPAASSTPSRQPAGPVPELLQRWKDRQGQQPR